MSGHYRKECKHGAPGAQCRCMGPKTIILVPCSETQCGVKGESLHEVETLIANFREATHALLDDLGKNDEDTWEKIRQAIPILYTYIGKPTAKSRETAARLAREHGL